MATDTKTRERPILFSGPMVRALLDGRKTQTRRVVKLPKRTSDDGEPWVWWLDEARSDHGFPTDDNGEILPMEQWETASEDQYRNHYLHVPNAHPGDLRTIGREGARCVDRVYPPWLAGDQLWVRETYFTRRSGTIPVYRASMDPVEAAGIGALYGGWKPSIFMPRKFSRITLEITNVRVERLQEIRAADVAAEGFTFHSDLDQFKVTWNALNAKHGFSWVSNPWVWILEFKVVRIPAKE